MDLKVINENAADLALEMEWLRKVIDARMKFHFGHESLVKDIYEIPLTDLSGSRSTYASIIAHYNVNVEERVALLLALAPHISPTLLDVFFVKNADYDRGFTEFGGIKGQYHSGFIPTAETLVFVVAGTGIADRMKQMRIFNEDHFFWKFNILKLAHTAAEEPLLSRVLSVSHEYLSYFTSGEARKPGFSSDFPAMRMVTGADWDDLVLEDHVLHDVEEIKAWIEHGETLMNEWELKKKIKPGFRTLFYGPPGTGKTMTASLLGKEVGMDVYRIDLSLIVSKYIGETEKNLANVFDQAENKSWILFFDEADAIFGKRTQTSSSNDRYANQEVSYLLQRIEDFPGVVILATNLKANIDDAFSRRFQSMIYFPMPGPDLRLSLWQKAFSSHSQLEDKINLKEIADKYELAGGAIINVLRYSSLMALRRGNNIILQQDILQGIRREFGKDGKTIS